MSTVRCFIAIELTDDLQRCLAGVQDELARGVPDRAVRWVTPDNVHLTLKFLGDTDTAALGRIGDRLEDVASRFAPFEFTLGKLGCFPNARKPRVIWVGVEGELGPLSELQQQVESVLAELGWTAENRRYHPHLTLGRVKDTRVVVEARYPWGKTQATGQQTVGEICLVKSDLQPTGAVYTVLRRARLAAQ